MDSFKASRLRHQFSASSGFRQKKANAILLVFLVTISLGIFAKEYQLKWTLAGYNGEIVFTTSVNIAQKFLTIHHHFSDPSFSISSLMILNGAADANMDSFFWSLVYPPTFLSIGENNLVTIQHDGHTARTLNLFALMHSQIINPHEIDQSSIYRFPVSAGLVPIIFLPASNQRLYGATIASITSNNNSAFVSLNFLQALQCDNCATRLTLTQV